MLNAVIDGKDAKISKEFKSRNDAIDYVFKLYSKTRVDNLLQLETEDRVEKHSVEYVCNRDTRFTITRA